MQLDNSINNRAGRCAETDEDDDAHGQEGEQLCWLTVVDTDAKTVATAPGSAATADNLKPGLEGAVRVDGRDPFDEQHEATVSQLPDDAPHQVKLDDGTYKRDGSGKVVSTESADGKVKREFEYGDAKLKDKLTVMKENGIVYKYLGPITSAGKPVMKDGLEMASWSKYDDKGNLLGNWYGARTIDKNGVYTERSDRDNIVRKEGADKKELSETEAKNRSEGGIWPGTIEVARPDGTRLQADLKGTTIETLKETYKDQTSGKEHERLWQRHGGKWMSDDRPAQERREMTLDATGTLTYLQPDNKRFVMRKDGSYSITENAITHSFDRHGTRQESVNAEGKRTFSFTGAGGKPVLSEVTTESGKYKSTWTRKPGTDEWSDGTTSEVRKNLKVLEDGSLEFTNADGLRVLEALSQRRTEFTADNKPHLIKFPSGAERHLKFDGNGLLSAKDVIPGKPKPVELVWQREGDGPEFVSKREGDQEFRRVGMKEVNAGDLEYTSKDNKTHTSRVADVDRIAKGEFVLSTESLMESRDRLSSAATKSGLNTERFNGWIRDFETNAAKYQLPAEKLVKTMNNLADILESGVESPLYKREQLLQIVDTAMHNIARPLEIDQGSHPTCNVTSVEVYAAAREPEHYTGLVKEVALTGKWQTTSGKTATPPVSALKPGKDETSYDLAKPDSGKRNLASQIVQMTLINAMYETGGMDKKTPTGVESRSEYRYIMGPNKTKTEVINGVTVTADIGEDSLVDGKNNPILDGKGNPVHGPEMVQDNVLTSAELLFGYKPAAIECAGYTDQPGQPRKYFNDLPKKETLLELKKNNKMPLLAPTMGGAHSQTIHDVWEDPQSGQLWILLDNQHGEPEVKGTGRKSGEGDGDGWITLDELHDTLKMNEQGKRFGLPIMPTIHKYDHPSKKPK